MRSAAAKGGDGSAGARGSGALSPMNSMNGRGSGAISPMGTRNGQSDSRKQMEYVKIGDECSFEGMRGGLMMGDTALRRLGVEVKGEQPMDGVTVTPSKGCTESIFRLVPMLSYRARMEYEAKRAELRTREQSRAHAAQRPGDGNDGGDGNDDASGNDEASGEDPEVAEEDGNESDESEEDADARLLGQEFQLLKELHRSEQNESRQNALAPLEQQGSVLNYGDVVQLLHVHSNLYVKLLERTAYLDKDCLALALGKGAEDCYFQLKPRFKTRSFGSPVYYDDDVAIVSLKGGLTVHGSQNKFYPSPMCTVMNKDVVPNSDNLGSSLPFHLQTLRQRELNASRDFFSFRIDFYQRIEHEGDLRTRAGFRLFHPESDSYVQASGSVSRDGMRTDNKTWKAIPYLKNTKGGEGMMTIVQGRVDANMSVKGLWSFENTLQSKGSSIPFDVGVRIRHIPSGKYLSCDTSSANAEDFDCALVNQENPQAAPGAFGSAHSLLFYVVPEDIVQVDHVPQNMSTMVRIEHRHSSDKGHLHFRDTNKPKVPCRASSAEKEDSRGNGIVFSRQQQAQDMLKLIPSSPEETLLVKDIIATRFILESFRWQMENARTVPNDLVENCITVLLRLMDHVTKGDGFGSGVASLMKKPTSEWIPKANSMLPTEFTSLFIGQPDVPYQNKIIECKIMDTIFDMALAAYNRFLRLDESGQLLSVTPASPADANPWTSGDGKLRSIMTKTRALQKFLHVTLQLFFNSNYRAQIYFSGRTSKFLELASTGSDGTMAVKVDQRTPWLQIIASQSEDPLGATVTLSKLFDNNERIIAAVVDVPLLQRFCRLITRCGPQPRFLRLFESICVAHGSPIIANQEMVLRQMWMNESVREKILVDVYTENGAAFHGADDKSSLSYNAPEATKFLASKETNHGKEIPAVFVTWAGTTNWEGDCDALFWNADALNLNASGVKIHHPTDKSEFQPPRTGGILLEALCWILEPEALCEKVLGKPWSQINPYATDLESSRHLRGETQTSDPERERKRATALRFKRQKQLANWFVAQLKLLRQMVFGRSYNCIRYIESTYTYPICLSMAWNPRLPHVLRSCALDLLVSLHVDRYPQLKNSGKPTIPEELWVFDSNLTDQGGSGVAKVRERALTEKDSLPGFFLDESHPFATFDDEAKSFKTGTKFYLTRLLANHNISKMGARLAHSERTKNEFAQSNLEVANTLLSFGFQSDISKLRDLGRTVARILDGRQDEESPNRSFFPSEDRFKDDAGNFLRVAQLKRSAIEILMKISDLRANYRLATILWDFRHKYNQKYNNRHNHNPEDANSSSQVVPLMSGKATAEEVRGPLSTDSNDTTLATTDSSTTYEGNFFKTLEEEIFINFEKLFNPGPDAADAVELDLDKLTGERTGDILIDCLMYEDDELFENAFRLLDRRFGQRRKLVAALKNVYLLDTPEIPIFGTANNLLGSCGHLLYVSRSTQEWAVCSKLSGEFDRTRFDFLTDMCQKLLDFMDCDSDEELQHRQSILNAVSLTATLLEALRIDVNLAFRGSVCEDHERLESQYMFLISIEYLVRVLGSFVKSNATNQAQLFPHIMSICHLIDCELKTCSPAEQYEDVHIRNQEHLEKLRTSCKGALLGILENNVSHCMVLASSKYQRIFDILSSDLNSDPSDQIALGFFLCVLRPREELPPIPSAQDWVMTVLLSGDTIQFRQALNRSLTFFENQNKASEQLLGILAGLMDGNNSNTAQKMTELLFGFEAVNGADEEASPRKQMDVSTSVELFSNALHHVCSLDKSVYASAEEETGDSEVDGRKASMIPPLAMLAKTVMLVLGTLPIDPDMLTSPSFWELCEAFCGLFEEYIAQLSGDKGSPRQKRSNKGIVHRNLMSYSLSVFEFCLKSAASNTLLEGIRDSYGSSLRRLMSICRVTQEAYKVEYSVRKCAYDVLVSAGEGIDEPKEMQVRRMTTRKSRLSLDSSATLSAPLKNREMAANLELFKTAVAANPRILHKIKLRRFDLLNEMESGVGQPKVSLPSDMMMQTMGVVLYNWLEKPFPSAVILGLVITGSILTFVDPSEPFENVCTVIFVSELVIRMNGFVQKYALGQVAALYRKVVNKKTESVVYPFFCDPVNVVDLICVLGDLFARLLLLFTGSGSAFTKQIFVFLKLFRLARLAKILRYIMQAFDLKVVNLIEQQKRFVTLKYSNVVKITWDDIVGRMETFGMANYFNPSKKETMIRMFDVLYYSLLRHRTTADNKELGVRDLANVAPTIQGFKNQREVYEHAQGAMVNNGVNKLLFVTISNSVPTWETDSVVYSAFRLSKEMLEGGNDVVQKSMIHCMVSSDSDGKFHQHLAARMAMTRKVIYEWRHGEDAGKDHRLDIYISRLEQASQTFNYMQMLVEGHNHELQILLSTQSTHIGSIDLLYHSVSTLLVLCETTEVIEDMLDEELELTTLLFDFLAESCYGPCEDNQTALATKLDTVIAIRNVLKLPNVEPEHEMYETEEGRTRIQLFISLKIAAVQLIFACFEGRGNTNSDDDVVPILKGKIEPMLIYLFEDNLDKLARKCLAEIEEHRLAGTRGCADYEESRQSYFEAVEGICKIRAIIDMFDRVQSASEEQSADKAGAEKATKRNVPLTSFTHVQNYAYDESLVGVVEVFWRGSTNQAYFPLPIERNLSEEVRDSFLEGVDVAVGRRMRDLVMRREDIMRDMELDAEFFGLYPLFRWAHHYEGSIRIGMYMMVLLLNYNVLLSDKGLRFLFDETFYFIECNGVRVRSMCLVQDKEGSVAPWAITWMAALFIFSMYLLMAIIHGATALRSVKSKINSDIKKEHYFGHKTKKNQLVVYLGPILLGAFSLLICLIQYASIGWNVFLRNTVYVFGSMVAVWTVRVYRAATVIPHDKSEYWFLVVYDTIFKGRFVASHIVLQTLLLLGFFDTYTFTLVLFDVFNFNRELQDILHGIIGPGKSLLLIAFTVVITLIVFGAVGSTFFSTYLDHEDGEGASAIKGSGDGDIEYGGAGCNTPISCFIYLLYFGLPDGNLNGIVEGANYEDSTDLYARMVYDLLFFILVGMIIFNIITGLILDAFSSQRQKSESRNAIFKNECFVCGLTRAQFKDMHLPAGFDNFEQHAFVEHSLWNYIFYIHVLYQKDKTDYTGLDTFVVRCLDTGQLTWLPSQTSYAIEIHGRENDDESSIWGELKSFEHEVKERFRDMSSGMESLRQELGEALGRLAVNQSAHHG